MLAALARLTFNQRSALVMRELEGRSYQEIAGVLDLSVGAVEALLFRARRRLQLERKALGVLSTAPLPGSLTSFLGAGGGAVAGGGAAVGAGVVLKAAAVVVAGAVTAGVGFKSVEAISAPATPAAAQANAPLVPGRAEQRLSRPAEPLSQTAAVRHEKLRGAAPVTRVSRFVRPNAPQQRAVADTGRFTDPAPGDDRLDRGTATGWGHSPGPGPATAGAPAAPGDRAAAAAPTAPAAANYRNHPDSAASADQITHQRGARSLQIGHLYVCDAHSRAAPRHGPLL